ncbi:MAG: LLM class flavin-dependent oxidoreductase, partial [Trebonia sp.]
GFDGIAVNEHHQSAYGLMPSPNLMAAALARRTSRARIMVLGNAIGIRGNPLRVAEEIAMLDLLSGGRVDSGFVRGIGWEYFAHSINPTKSRSRFNEAHDLIIKAWTSPEMFSWYGENYEYRYVNLWPRPIQQPHPPIYIPGAGSTETMKFCAERRYTYMSVYAPTPIVRRWFDGYRQAAADLGYVADPEKIAFSVPIYVADTDEQAHAQARPAVEWLYHKGLKQTPEMVTPPGYMSPGSLRGVLSSGMRSLGGSTYEDLLARGQAVVGSPASVADRLGELYDDLGGFGQIIGLFAIGPSAHEQVKHSAELFATEVMPVLRPLGTATEVTT